MDSRRVLFAGLLFWSLFLEAWARWILPLLGYENGFALWPAVDNVMHFFWGVNFFFFFVLVLRWRPLGALLGVYAWQMAWEAGEMIGDLLVSQPSFMFDHFFFDGIKDTFVDVAGALLGWAFLFGTREKFAGLREHMRLKRFLAAHLACMLPLLPVGIVLFLSTGESHDLLATAWIVLAVPAAFALVRYARPSTDKV